MMALSERTRPSAEECLRLPWFQSELASACASPGLPVRVLAADIQLRPWQRVALMDAAAQLPSASLKKLERSFRLLDRRRAGAIRAQDLQGVLEDLGVAPDASGEAASALIT